MNSGWDAEDAQHVHSCAFVGDPSHGAVDDGRVSLKTMRPALSTRRALMRMSRGGGSTATTRLRPALLGHVECASALLQQGVDIGCGGINQRHAKAGGYRDGLSPK